MSQEKLAELNLELARQDIEVRKQNAELLKAQVRTETARAISIELENKAYGQ